MAVRTAVPGGSMVRMGSPVRFRRGAPHQNPSSGWIRCPARRLPDSRHPPFARDLPERKLVAMRPTYQISIAGQQAAEVRKRLFTPFGDRFTIDVPGPDDLDMTGDPFDHEFTIRRGGQTVATISKQWFSMRDTYAVDVAPGQDDVLILASVLALDLAEDQERSQH